MKFFTNSFFFISLLVVCAACGKTPAGQTDGGGNPPVVKVSDEGLSARQIPSDSTDNILMNWLFCANSDVRVADMDVTITLDNGNSTGPNVATLGSGMVAMPATTTKACYTTSGFVDGISEGDAVSMPTASGTVYAIVVSVNAGGCDSGNGTQVITADTTDTLLTAGTIQEFNPYASIKNVKVVDLDTGSTLMGPMAFASDKTWVPGPPDTYKITFTEDHQFTAGVVRSLGLSVDTDLSMPPGYLLYARIDYTRAGYIKDSSTGEDIHPDLIQGGNLTGEVHTTSN